MFTHRPYFETPPPSPLLRYGTANTPPRPPSLRSAVDPPPPGEGESPQPGLTRQSRLGRQCCAPLSGMSERLVVPNSSPSSPPAPSNDKAPPWPRAATDRRG